METETLAPEKVVQIDENEEIVAYLQGEAQTAPEPGDTAGSVVSVGDEKAPFPAVIHAIESAGWAYIYDRRTGDQSKCSVNMVPYKLRERQADGAYVWTLRDPGFRPKQGDVKCRLHVDDELRSVWDEYGLPICPKATLKDQYQLLRHMGRKHKEEFAVMEDRREREEKAERERREEEDRKFQRSLMKAVKPRRNRGE